VKKRLQRGRAYSFAPAKTMLKSPSMGSYLNIDHWRFMKVRMCDPMDVNVEYEYLDVTLRPYAATDPTDVDCFDNGFQPGSSTCSDLR
jgi:hypothetical protein